MYQRTRNSTKTAVAMEKQKSIDKAVKKSIIVTTSDREASDNYTLQKTRWP